MLSKNYISVVDNELCVCVGVVKTTPTHYFLIKEPLIMAKYKFTYEAPRFAKISGFVKQLSLLCDVDCKIEITKGLIFESGTVVCKGADNNVIKFKNEMDMAMAQYNAD